MIETKITKDYSKVKTMTGVALILLVLTVGTAMAFTTSDADRINAVSKKMAEVTTEIALTEIKYSDLASELAVINEKMGLVENHKSVLEGRLESYKTEIQQIINPAFQSTEK